MIAVTLSTPATVLLLAAILPLWLRYGTCCDGCDHCETSPGSPSPGSQGDGTGGCPPPVPHRPEVDR